jgi:hypothetical protein
MTIAALKGCATFETIVAQGFSPAIAALKGGATFEAVIPPPS